MKYVGCVKEEAEGETQEKEGQKGWSLFVF